MRAASSSRHGRVADMLGRRIVSGALRPDVARPSATDQRQVCPVADHVVPDHRAVVEAIRRGDADGARAAIKTLLVQSEADPIGRLKDGEGGR